MTTKISEVARHILLYSKGHYGSSEDMIHDLKVIIDEVTCAYSSTEDVWRLCTQTMVDLCTPRQQKDFLMRLFHPFGCKFMEQSPLYHAINMAVGFMGTVTVKDNPLLPDGLGEVSPEIALAIKS